MAKKKKLAGDDEVLKPVELPEEEEKDLPLADDETLGLDDDTDEEDEEETEGGEEF